jgi:polyisoprenyl-phosphate glycosyltransferase
MTTTQQLPSEFVASSVPRPARRTLSIVIPVLNEARGLETLVARLREALEVIERPFEVIFIDDGSTDATLELLRRMHGADTRIKALSFSRNFGKEIAVAAGLKYASGDGVVVMDGDLQHPPHVIAEFVGKWDEGFEIVYGRRRDRDTDPAVHRMFSRVFYRLFEKMSGTELPDGAGDFRLLDRKAVDALNRIGERSRFNKGLYAWIGFRTIGVPFDVAARLDGRSRWSPRKLLRFALDGLASFTTLPLRVWSYLGLVVSAFAFFYAVVFTVKTLLWGVDLPGFPTLIISVMFFAGVQLISLGVMGEYLGRVYEEVKGRPLFIVGERVGVNEPHTEPTRTGQCSETPKAHIP